MLLLHKDDFMMFKLRSVVILLLMLVFAVTVQAQENAPVNPNAMITWPPPVFVVSGEFTIHGSANLPNMTNYFIEYRALNEDQTIPDETAPWLPATLPIAAPVLNDVLGVWNTTTEEDGVYELHLIVNVRGGTPVIYRLSPIRILNAPPPFAAIPTAIPVLPTVSSPILATPMPTPFDTTPRVTATTNANIRRGDSTFHEVLGALRPGDSATIIGISDTGSGWYNIQLSNGSRGWIAPSVVTVSGDTRNLPRISPPAPPTPTPIPFTPTPITQANLAVNSLSLSVDPPRCKETFVITVRVTNFGSGSTSSSGSIAVQDVRASNGTIAATTSGGFPILTPGQSFDATIPLTVDTFFNEAHRITIVIDSLSQIAETNEGDNVVVRDYALQKAACS
jgi:uncharacterized protein YgiM (DUF1202 family)